MPKKINADKLVAAFTILAEAEARRKSNPNTRTNMKTRKLPVRAKESVIEANHAAEQGGQEHVTPAMMAILIHRTEIFPDIGIEGYDDQQHQHQWPQPLPGQQGNSHGPEIRQDKSRQGSRQSRLPGDIDTTGIAQRSAGSAENAGKFVGAENRCGWCLGLDIE